MEREETNILPGAHSAIWKHAPQEAHFILFFEIYFFKLSLVCNTNALTYDTFNEKNFFLWILVWSQGNLGTYSGSPGF